MVQGASGFEPRVLGVNSPLYKPVPALHDTTLPDQRSLKLKSAVGSAS